MARKVCIKPCPPNIVLPKFTVPLMGSAMKAQGSFSVQGGCDGCELVGNLLLQLNPLLASLGLPLCILGCITSIIGFVKAVPDALGPPPDPSKLITAGADIVTKCQCIVSFALPPPVGVICDFLLMVRDIINLFALIIGCLTGLVQHLASFSLKASILLASPIPELRATGSCLIDQGQGMMDLLNQKLGALGTLLAVLGPVFDLLATVVPPPFSQTILNFKNGFVLFQTGTSIGTPPGPFLSELQTFNAIVQTTSQTFTTIVSVCPGA